MSTSSTAAAATAAAASSSPAPPLPYRAEAAAAAAAVRLASKLCERVQATLGSGEKSDKEDDSPVTVADYGAQALVAFSLTRSGSNLASENSKDSPGKEASSSVPFSMVAEEDSADLRDPAKNGPAMTRRITQLVNEVLKDEGLISDDGNGGGNGENEKTLPSPLTPEEVLALIDLGSSPGGSDGRHWVLDPIDGTRGFVGKRQYAVCLALLDAGKLAVGVLGCPNVPSARALADGDGGPQEGLGERRPGVGALFWGTRGGGAYVQPLHGSKDEALDESNRLSVGGGGGGETKKADRSKIRFMESFDSRHSDFSTAARLAAALRVTSPPLRLDSQAKYGCLARGDAAINLRFPRKVRGEEEVFFSSFFFFFFFEVFHFRGFFSFSFSSFSRASNSHLFLSSPPPLPFTLSQGYREKIWDHAPGALLVIEAGGSVSDASGSELDFGQGRWLDLDRGIVTAASPEIHAELIEALKPGGAVGDA